MGPAAGLEQQLRSSEHADAGGVAQQCSPARGSPPSESADPSPDSTDVNCHGIGRLALNREHDVCIPAPGQRPGK